MSARRLILAGLTSLCALCGCFALAGVPARAAVIHDYLSQITEVPASAPVPGPLKTMESMTVDSGHLWIAEIVGANNSRVDEFDASTGAFISQPVHPEFPSKSLIFYRGGIAVGHASGEAELYVGEYAGGEAVVAVFSEAGTPKATWTGADTPAKSFGKDLEKDVVVDNSKSLSDWAAGNVYVTAPSQHVIDVFHPEAGGKEKYVTQLTGISPSEPFGSVSKMAVNEANGDLVVLDGRTVDVFEPTVLGEYAFVRKITGPPPSGFGSTYNLAVDGGNGDIYATDGFEPVAIDEFSSTTGAYLGHITGVGSSGGNIDDVYSLAVDPASHDVYVADYRESQHGSNAVKVFGPDLVVPDVTTAPVPNPRARSATLNGTVNPDKAGAATCQFVWGATAEFGHTAPCSAPVAEGGSPVAVEAQLGGLEPDTSYCYRLQATNGNGTNPGEAWQDQCFTTPGPGLHAEAVSAVTAESVTFDATINPHNASTTYYFQYGTTSSYGTNVPVPPGAAVGSGEGDAEVSQHVQGFQAGAVYHYRVVAVSEVAGRVEEFDGPDQAFTTQRSGAFSLPDGRQWEMVTPPQKQGALFSALTNGEDSRQKPLGVMKHVIQAAAGGSAIANIASLPSEAEPQGYSSTDASVLSTRGSSGWSSQVIAPPHAAATGPDFQGEEYRLFSDDLSRGVVQPTGPFDPLLSGEATESTAYLHTDFLNGNVDEHCQTSCFQPLVTAGNTRPGAVFGEVTVSGECFKTICGPRFVGGTPDLRHVILASAAQLTSTPVLEEEEEEQNYYEWSGGRLQLISVLPGSEAGGGVKLAGIPYQGARHAISDDGGRVVLEGSHGRLSGVYLREVAQGETVRLDVAEPGCVSCGSGAGEFVTASSDDSRIFFLDHERLTKESSASGGSDLYEYDLNAPPGSRLTDLTVDANTGEPANVGAVVGASEDGAYVYFVAGGRLAPGAVSNGECTGKSRCSGCTGKAPCNLYVRHAGQTRLIAELSSEDLFWDGSYGLTSQSSVRVSPDGRWLAFMSNRGLTGYDTRDAVSGRPDEEVYLYNAASNGLVCASCDPTGARPIGLEAGNVWVASFVPGWNSAFSGEPGIQTYQPRYLSDSGRLFFDSKDALVPLDVNNVLDVYEYEPEGTGAEGAVCGPGSASGSEVFKPARGFEVEGGRGEEWAGCVGLISAGTSPEESTFLEASETGGDVFFMTTSKLASQDFDRAYDVYDAHECTGTSPCFPAPAVQPPPCDTEASCKVAPTPQPALFGAPASATFSGQGNAPPTGVREPSPPVKPRALTRARKLAAALKACRKRPKTRMACEARARKRYGAAKTAKRAGNERRARS